MKRLATLFLLLFLVQPLIIPSPSSAYAYDPVVYVTRTGTKYHSAGCRYLKKSSISMKLSEVVQKYSPCSVCNPPTVASSVNLGPSSQSMKVQKQDTTCPRHSSETAVGTTATGKTIYEGPRGGHYHYSKSGKKVYGTSDTKSYTG